MTFSHLTVSEKGIVATITLARPNVRNAFSDAVIEEITTAFTEVGARANIRAVVLAAEGTAFCAGADLHWMRRMADYTREENLAGAGKLATMLRLIERCPKPTIARVQGDVYAGGLGLVAACDMAVAVDSAHFCLSEVKIGLIPATIAPYVIRAMGARAAQRYFLTWNWDTDAYEQGTAFGHIALGVPDAYATCAHIKAAGGQVTREAGPLKGDSTVIAFVTDPDDYKIELIQTTEGISPDPLRNV